MLQRLPIDEVLPALLSALAEAGQAVLLAPPGAGKTTRVPPAVLDAGLAGDGRILVLQPRRVAARAAARRIAEERGGRLGGEVGYRVRFDDRTGADTRIELLTEGLLTRRLQSDPFLEGVGCVVFDEFHERSLHADLGLALLREVRREVRPDLKLVVMSATLDPGPVAEWLGAPVVRAAGRTFPVEVQYAPRDDDRPLPTRCAGAIRQALAEEPAGHVLVFLPGVGEIERTAEALGPLDGIDVLPLHGRLTGEAQDRALAPQQRRKVVLATNIAETSVTLDGVRVVVDSGEARVPRFDPAIGLERLERGRISRASAEQRAGRAGRTGPGRCLRLWTESTHRGLAPYEAPEVARVDLTRAVLELRAWGADPRTFAWFEAPPARTIDRAEALLRRLGALDDAGVTALGETLLALPVHPRLGRVVLAGLRAGRLREAAAVAALAAERDVFVDPPALVADSDLDLRLDALDARRPPRGVSHRALTEVRRARDQLVRIAEGLGEAPRAPDPAMPAARLLLAGFPDRVGRRRAPRSDRFKLASGLGARLSPQSAVKDAPLIVAVSLRGARRGERAEHVVEVASAVEPAWLPVEEAVETRFDPAREAVVQVRTRRYLALVLDEVPAGEAADRAAVSAALAEAAAADPARAFGWPDDPAAAGLLARLRWLARARPAWAVPTFPELGGPAPEGSDGSEGSEGEPAEVPSTDGTDAIEPTEAIPPPSELIRTLCDGRRSFAELRRIGLAPILEGLLPHAMRSRLDREAPARLTLPDGTSRPLDYAPGHAPVLATRFERLFGLRDTPRLAGRPIRLHLLAPNRRPVQITDDLASFWATTYPQVRKELRGRYPKHPWPEDPLSAPPGIHRRR